MFPRRFGTGEDPQQRLAVARGDRRAQPSNTGREAIDLRQQLVAIGKTDVVPHGRVAGRDAGKVPETTGGIAENISYNFV